MATMLALGAALSAFALASGDDKIPGELDELKGSFATLSAEAAAKFERTSRFAPILVDPGTDLPRQTCLTFKTRIKANYKIDPFDYIFEGGAAISAFCVTPESGRRNFHAVVSGLTNLGHPFTNVITLDRPDSQHVERTTYFVDAGARIVEVQSITYNSATSEMTEFSVTSLDKNGDVYFASMNRRYRVEGKDVDGTFLSQGYIAADGSHSRPLRRSLLKHRTERAKDIEIIELNTTTARDWQDFQLPVTHAWSGGFYSYDGHYVRDARQSRSLVLKFQDGQLKHACGEIKTAKNWKQIPSNAADYQACIDF